MRGLAQLIGQNQEKFLSDPQQMGSYGYGRGNPIRYSDPEGEWAHIAAGAIIGGTVGHSIVEQGLRMADGSQPSFESGEVLSSMGLGAITSRIPGLKFAPVSAGKGSYAAIQKQMYTKLQNGTISFGGIRPYTAGKMVMAGFAQQGPGQAVQSALSAISRQLTQISATISKLMSSKDKKK